MKPVASLSLDLDDQWSYMKIHGDPEWKSFPSYLEVLIPRLLDFLAERDLEITIFVVGQDAALEKNKELLAALASAGHEIGNHSFHHDSWLHHYSEEELEDEVARAEEAIENATGCRPLGFRGPGFSLSRPTLRVLARRGYRYDASTLPTYLGPLARAFYFRTARLSEDQRRQRTTLFGTFSDGLRPLKPYRWRLEDGSLIEIPVTTLPILRTPIHVSYLLYLSLFSPALARMYFRTAMRLCLVTGVQPSILLHPLDFLGGDDVQELSFFPAMQRPAQWKLETSSRILAVLSELFQIVPIGQHVDRLKTHGSLPERLPHFRHPGKS